MTDRRQSAATDGRIARRPTTARRRATGEAVRRYTDAEDTGCATVPRTDGSDADDRRAAIGGTVRRHRLTGGRR